MRDVRRLWGLKFWAMTQGDLDVIYGITFSGFHTLIYKQLLCLEQVKTPSRTVELVRLAKEFRSVGAEGLVRVRF